MQVQTIKKDYSDRNNFKKGKNNTKGGIWSKGKNKCSEKGESLKGANSYQNKKKCFDKKKIQCFNCDKFCHFSSECWLGKESKQRMIKSRLRLLKKIQILTQV